MACRPKNGNASAPRAPRSPPTTRDLNSPEIDPTARLGGYWRIAAQSGRIFLQQPHCEPSVGSVGHALMGHWRTKKIPTSISWSGVKINPVD
eukprot:8079802-Pyramimonas_sp.AAC.1